MAKFRSINTKFWVDPYVISLDTSTKLLFLYFLTNPYTEICGAYEITLRQIQFDTGLDTVCIQTGISLLQADKKIIYKDGWVFLPNWVKNQSLNPSVVKGILNSLQNAPDWVKQATDWDSLYPVSPQAVGMVLNGIKENGIEEKKTDFLKNSRETLKDKWGTKK